MMAYICNASTWEVKTMFEFELSLKLVWIIQWISGRPALQNKIVPKIKLKAMELNPTTYEKDYQDKVVFIWGMKSWSNT